MSDSNRPVVVAPRRPAGDLVISLTAWAFYATSQEDLLLPALATVLVVVTTIAWKGPTEVHRVSALLWWTLLPASLVAGWAWRAFVMPVPDGIVGGAVIGAFAPAAILLGVTLLLLGHRVALIFAWLCAAWAANSQIDPGLLVGLGVFAIANLAVLSAGWRRGRAASRQGGAGAVATFTVAWVLATVGVLAVYDIVDGLAFESIEKLIESFDVSLPSRSTGELVLVEGEDPSGLDTRPVLEVTPPEVHIAAYLRTRVFARWLEPSWRAEGVGEVARLPSVETDERQWRIFLLRRFRRSVPAPAGVRSISAAADLDTTDLVRPVARPLPRALRLSTGPTRLTPVPTATMDRLLEVPDELLQVLDDTWERIGIPPDRSPVEQAEAVDAYFEDHFRYSLKPGLPRGAGAIERFLDEQRPAFCVHFATAATFLLRSRGIPTRLVGGFIATEREGNRLVVRIRDAHTWIELFVPTGDGTAGHWVSIDPSPGQARLDTVAHLEGTKRVVDRVQRALRRAFAWLASAPLTAWAGLVAALIVALYLIVRRRRPKRKTLDSPATDPTHTLYPLYQRFDAGVAAISPTTTRASESDQELLARLGERPEVEHLLPAAQAFLERYRQARYRPAGDRDGLEEPLARFERAVAENAARSRPAGD